MALAAGLYVGWNVGSNDAANAMGTPVGAQVISYRRAVLIMMLFVLLGAVLEGEEVMKTVGSGIVVSPEHTNPLTEMPEIAVIALFAAGLWVTIATTLKLPVSTSQAVVGAVIGAGMFLSVVNTGLVSSTSVKFSILQKIFGAWAIVPVGSALISYLTYYLTGHLLRGIKKIRVLQKIMIFLVVLSGAFAAYSLGANTVGNVTAPIYAVVEGKETFSSTKPIAFFGGVAVVMGVLTYSRKVMKTVGKGITSLDTTSAFSAQLGAGLTVWLFAQIGIPVSTTQAIVGGVAGAGLVKSTAAVSKRKLGEIVLGWILTPTTAACLTIVLSMLIIGG